MSFDPFHHNDNDFLSPLTALSSLTSLENIHFGLLGIFLHSIPDLNRLCSQLQLWGSAYTLLRLPPPSLLTPSSALPSTTTNGSNGSVVGSTSHLHPYGNSYRYISSSLCTPLPMRKIDQCELIIKRYNVIMAMKEKERELEMKNGGKYEIEILVCGDADTDVYQNMKKHLKMTRDKWMKTQKWKQNGNENKNENHQSDYHGDRFILFTENELFSFVHQIQTNRTSWDQEVKHSLPDVICDIVNEYSEIMIHPLSLEWITMSSTLNINRKRLLPATDEDILELERKMGCPCPLYMKALWKIQNGCEREEGEDGDGYDVKSDVHPCYLFPSISSVLSSWHPYYRTLGAFPFKKQKDNKYFIGLLWGSGKLMEFHKRNLYSYRCECIGNNIPQSLSAYCSLVKQKGSAVSTKEYTAALREKCLLNSGVRMRYVEKSFITEFQKGMGWE